MSRIPPAPLADLPTELAAELDAIRQPLGRLPNMIAVLANSASALDGYLKLDRALSQGRIAPETRQRIQLAIAEINGCAYCLSAGVHHARQRGGLDDAEITANRNGASNDPKADAAVRLAVLVALARGRVSDADLARFKASGYGDEEAIEIAALVALSTLKNTVNNLALTDIDFPPVALRRAA